MSSQVASDVDSVGHIESAGIEYLPEAVRDSRPRNLFAVFVGSNVNWATAVYGWVAVELGLSFSSTVSSTLVGGLIGVLFLAPLGMYGPRTGTNMTVSSGAYFGIRGRFIGSSLALAFGLMFTALSVWTSGDAIVASVHRLLGIASSSVTEAFAYGVVIALIAAAALYGHATIVALQKVLVPLGVVILVAALFVFAPHFSAGHRVGPYALGNYWDTWALNVILSCAGVISFATVIGDYTRRISQKRFRDRSVCLALGSGVFVGTVVPTLVGAFTAVALVHTTGDYLSDLVRNAPGWFVAPILVLAILGGVGQGVLSLYDAGLDLESFIPRLTRLHTTIASGLIAIVLLYLGVFVLHAVNSITAATTVLNAVATPWVTVLLIGIIRDRRRGYDPEALQDFAHRRRGGRYWFSGGWNLPAVVAMAAGSAWGLLSVDTQLYAGPLSQIWNGVDPSLVGSCVVAAVSYLLLTAILPRSGPAPHDLPASSQHEPAPAEDSIVLTGHDGPMR